MECSQVDLRRSDLGAVGTEYGEGYEDDLDVADTDLELVIAIEHPTEEEVPLAFFEAFKLLVEDDTFLSDIFSF